MRRSPLLAIHVLCPHFRRPVVAQRNEATGQLVDCASKDECAVLSVTESGVTLVVRPRECPVFRARG